MVETQIIKENENPISVILDIEEFNRLKEIESEQLEYQQVIKTKEETKEWFTLEQVKEELGIE